MREKDMRERGEERRRGEKGAKRREKRAKREGEGGPRHHSSHSKLCELSLASKSFLNKGRSFPKCTSPFVMTHFTFVD